MGTRGKRRGEVRLDDNGRIEAELGSGPRPGVGAALGSTSPKGEGSQREVGGRFRRGPVLLLGTLLE